MMNIKQITFIVINLLLFIGLVPAQIFANNDSIHFSAADSIREPLQYPDSASLAPSEQIIPTPILIKTDTNKLNSVNSISDSILLEKKRDSLQNNLSSRLSIFDRATKDSIMPISPFYISNETVYQSDMSSPSELLVSYPLITFIPFGLSNSLNRSLYFGNTAPITSLKSGLLLKNTQTHPFEGTDQTFLTEAATLQFHPGYLTSQNPSYALSVPEVLIFWENGVFNENTLNIRFSRPFTRTLTAHIFSNYRYFQGKSYNHKGNNIFSFFNFFQDSVNVSLKGYTPLTNEHSTGASLHWNDHRNSTTVSIQYGEFNNEVSLNKPAEIDKAAQAMYHRYPLSLNVNTSIKLPGAFFTDLELEYQNEPITRLTGEQIQNSSSIQPVRKDAKETRIDAAMRTGLQLMQNDSVGIGYIINTHKRIFFNDSETDVLQHRPVLFYNKKIKINNLIADVSLDVGSVISSFEDSTTISLQWHASTNASFGNKQLRLYLNQDLLPFISDFDTITSNTFIVDDYLRAGCELNLNYNLFNVLLGYQLISNIDTQSVINAWPSGIPPYQQSRSSFIVAPSIALGKKTTFKTHAMISDVKPYVKAFGSLDYVIHPINTSEFIDISIYAGYWSEREDVTFAGRDDWNKPIIHSGLKIAAHIRSFRLFYKVDNILNRHFAYVPGYYSPGITFRWGFNWFIQR